MAVPVTGTAKKESEYLTCMSGERMDSNGHAGLTDFMCRACIQMITQTYLPFDSREKQELHLSSKMANQIRIRAKHTFGMSRDGKFRHNAADDFALRPMEGGTMMKPVSATCLTRQPQQRFEVGDFLALVQSSMVVMSAASSSLV